MNGSFSSTISKTNPNIMEYLAQKLEAKSKGMLYSKQLINGIFDIQSLQSYKKNIIAFLSEIEDDLKQASYAIKGLFIENKALTLEIDQLKERLFSLEENNKNYINDLTNSHNYLVAENAELKEQLLVYSNNLNNNTIQIDNNEYDKRLSNITEETELEMPIKKMQTQESEGSNNNRQMNLNINDNSQSENAGLHNVQNIISNMKHNKKKLKEALKQHFKVHQQESQYDINDSCEEEYDGNYSNDDKTIKNKWSQKKSSDLLKKINDNPTIINDLNLRLEKDVMKKLKQGNCSEDYLIKIESFINEQNDSRIKTNKLPIRIRNCKSKSNSKTISNNTQSIKKDKQRSLSSSFVQQSSPINQQAKGSMKANNSFEHTLREYPKNKWKKQKKKDKNPKPQFNHYLNPYGKYFTNPCEQTMNLKPIKR